jgi:hypothetical protein
MDFDQPVNLAIPCLDSNGQHDLSEDGFPWRWLQAAAGLPAKSLHVGLIIWYAAGRLGSSSVFLSNTLCMLFGLDRNAKYRGLRSLQDAGLVAVERKRGKSPLVTILDARRHPMITANAE